MKYLITGSEGWIGSYLLRVLKDAEVVRFDLKLGHDLLNYENLKNAIEGQDAIFHLAGIVGIKQVNENMALSQRVNVEGTLMLLEAMREVNPMARLIFPSSSSIYGLQESHIMREDMIPRPMSLYGLQKLTGEQYCQMYNRLYGIEVIILRLFNPYGEGQPRHYLIERFKELRRLGRPLTIYGDGETTRDFIFIGDLVDAVQKASKIELEGRCEVLNIGSGVEISVNQIARWIGGEVEYVLDPREGIEERRKVAEITRARQLLDWQPTVFIDKETIYKDSPEK